MAMEWLWDINIWSSLLTLTVLEIVLGIDNIVFITLLVRKLPVHQREFARQFGLLAAMGTRVLLLLSVAWLARLVNPLFEVMGHCRQSALNNTTQTQFRRTPIWK